MEREPVVSESIASVGYDAETQTLEIEFTSGRVYEYYSVPDDVHAELMAAASHGQYFDASIKKADYKFGKIE